ncbi:hypothetical protein [Chamaesiphon minutus]|uniref:YkuD domain-containing protein n=1 Tax=Chamaesiphon minutus (strain ATCC 27169 / PCC 6605) TaxID=1173020 RepID=K9UPL3_CHAP6|nr:hypothetical protein [Chamaesiphon minutus]AFY96628.1 hypothetical protein Cha6605_5772 [Chamaesiphon minutus PCC 6605]
MHKVLIAARTLGWCAIALAICSCNSNFPSNAQSISSTAHPVSSPNTLAQPAQPDPAVSSSPAGVSKSPQAGTTPTESVMSEPYVNPLDSIVLNAKNRVAKDPTAKSKSAALTPTRLNLDVNDGNAQFKQLSKALALTKQQPQSPSQNRISASASCRAFPCLILSRDPSNSQNRFNNPIYKLTAYRDRTSDYVFQLDAVTGRGFTQARNRYQSDTDAPLPDGSYSVVPTVVKGTIREVGGTMVPIFPKPGFNPRMRRTALGIHWDPSFDRDNKEDGTSGCIGMTKKYDYHQVRNFVLKYRPRSLEVQITR